MLKCVVRLVAICILSVSMVILNSEINSALAKPMVKKDSKDSNKKAKEKAKEFTLKDQFGNDLVYKFPKQKLSILAFGDKDGADQLENWIRPLYEKYTDKIDILGIAELSIVPGIAKGIVRGMIKKKSKQAVGLDWSGAVSKSFSYQKKQANIILIDKEGSIIHKQIGAMTEEKLKQLEDEIDLLLK